MHCIKVKKNLTPRHTYTQRYSDPLRKPQCKLTHTQLQALDATQSFPLTQEQGQQDKRQKDYLHELHEEVHVLGVELLREVVRGLVQVLRQRVLLAAADVVALPPDTLHVLPRRLRRRRRHFGGSTSTGLRRGSDAAWVARKCRS